MRLFKYILTVSFLTILLTPDMNSQNCKKFHLYGSCILYPGTFYKMDGQSRSNIIGLGDKFTYNVVFFGGRQYKLIFCATDMFNPVKYILTDALSKEVIYDNSNDEYSETVEMTIEDTRKITIEISVLAIGADKDVVENYYGCVGFLMYWRWPKK